MSGKKTACGLASTESNPYVGILTGAAHHEEHACEGMETPATRGAAAIVATIKDRAQATSSPPCRAPIVVTWLGRGTMLFEGHFLA